MPGGGLLIDTPGLRALGQTGSEEGISSAFPEIQDLASACRFRDCAHEHEPGCAVKSAVESGEVEAGRLASYQKLMAEANAAARKTEVRLREDPDRKRKIISKAAKAYFKQHRRG
jgi:ribosome biogenesis GTPase